MLGSWSADSTIDFQNPIQILAGSGPQTVQVTAGSGTAAVDSRLSGVLSGSGGLTVVGWGSLELTASNTYLGPTTISDAILRLSNPAALPGGVGATATGGNLTLDGGVVELNAGDFSRGLGSGTGQVQFTAKGGGFAACGGQPNRQFGRHFGRVDLGWQRQFSARPSSAHARQLVGGFDDRFSKPDPDTGGQWAANRPSDCRLGDGRRGCTALGRPQR